MKIFIKDDKGQGLIEYGLILFLVSIVAVRALGGVGEKVITSFDMFSYSSPHLADDADFIGNRDGEFKYIGNQEVVHIPHVIKGVEVTSYKNMFSGVDDSRVRKVVSDNPNITDMSYMFFYSKAKTLDLSSFDTHNVKDMSRMFRGSSATQLNIGSFVTDNVTSMWDMFREARAVELDVSSFNTRKVTNMHAMFYLSNVTEIDLSSFDTRNVTNMNAMFTGLNMRVLDLSTFVTDNVTDMNRMFSESSMTIVYGQSQSDVDRFNAIVGNPSDLIAVVK